MNSLGSLVQDTLSIYKENNSTEPGVGKNRRPDATTSLIAIGAAFVPTATTAAVYLVAFFFLRSRYQNLYAPRTYFKTIPEKERTPSTRPNGSKWYHDFLWMDEKSLLKHHSLDGYLFLRFFRVIIAICVFGCLLTWPILFPVNITGGGDAKQLDRLSFSNAVGEKRLYAHAVVAWIFVIFILLLVTRERMFLIGLKQAYVTTKHNSSRLSSRTVLFLAAPAGAYKEGNLQRYFGADAVRCWKCPKLPELQSLVDSRNDKAYALESAEISLTQNVNAKKSKDAAETGNSGEEGRGAGPDQSLRPTTRTIPFVGKKVDEIDWNIEHLTELIQDIDQRRQAFFRNSHRDHGAIFVEFKDQLSAYQAYESVRHHSPLALQPRCIGMQPKEVLWSNLTLSSSTQIMYSYVSIAIMVATIVLWSIPVGFVALLSNIDYLTDKVKWLGFINNLPDAILGLIKGFLPPFLMSELVSYVPKFFRHVCRYAGAPTTVAAEARVQRWYFAFQLIQVFLITTFSSGATSIITQITNNPKSVPALLANNLPTASNFYLSYFILQGTASMANNLLNYSDLFEFVFFYKFWDNTPRQKYDRISFMRGMSWGTVYPKFTNLTVIAIAYSCIAPLMLGFAAPGFYLFYLSYRYGLFYTKQVKIDTKGEAYGRALQSLLTGVYLLELCLFGLLGVREAEGPSTLVLILLIATVLYHVTVNKYLTPLEQYMPVDVLTEQDEDQNPLLSAEEADVDRPHGKSVSRFLSALAGGTLPSILADPLAPMLEPHVFPSHEDLRPWLVDDRAEDGDASHYSEDEIKNAYLNPVLVSKTPKLWLAKDSNQVSQWAIDKNKSAGIDSTDAGAKIDSDNRVHWNDEDLSSAPIFKAPKQY